MTGALGSPPFRYHIIIFFRQGVGITTRNRICQGSRNPISVMGIRPQDFVSNTPADTVLTQVLSLFTVSFGNFGIRCLRVSTRMVFISIATKSCLNVRGTTGNVCIRHKPGMHEYPIAGILQPCTSILLSVPFVQDTRGV